MKIFAFTVIVIAGTVVGVFTAAPANSNYHFPNARDKQRGAITGAIGGIVVAGIGLWLTGEKKKPD